MRALNIIPVMAVLLAVFVTGCKKDEETFTYPTGTSSDPTSNATDVSRNKGVTFTFNEAMDPLTVNSLTFTLMHGTTAVPGRVTYNAKTATFTPLGTLDAGTVYTAKVTTGAKTLSGSSLASDAVWNFTTGGTASNLAAVQLGTAGNYVILAKTAINTIATSIVTGDLGLSPAATSYITGFSLTNATGYATAVQVLGKIYAADMVAPTPINLTTAVNNMSTGYDDAAGRTSPL